jgi:DNA invertase Pin-like site-specific DNA recombinase
MILYTRVSTEEQAASGLGLEAQRADLQRAAEYHNWHVVQFIRDEGASGKDLRREGLRRALALIAAGSADGLAVAKLDRLTRSVIDFGELLEWLDAADATLVALDLNIDTSSPSGMMVATVLVAVAQWERDTIGARTSAGLAALRAQGKPTGRPAVADLPELTQRIRSMAEDEGMSLREIADVLNTEGVPTLRGGAKWRHSSVQSAAGYHRPKPRRKAADLPELPRRKRRR